MFLIFAVLLTFSLLVSCIWYLIMVLSDPNNKILENMLNEEAVFYISLGLVGISILLLIFLMKNPLLYMLTSAAGLIMLFILFVMSNKTNDIKINPAAIILSYLILPGLMLIFSNLYDQTRFISVGITTKQNDSIEIFKSTNQRLLIEEEEIDMNINKLANTKFSVRVKNLFRFLCKPKSKSLLYSKYN